MQTRTPEALDQVLCPPAGSQLGEGSPVSMLGFTRVSLIRNERGATGGTQVSGRAPPNRSGRGLGRDTGVLSCSGVGVHAGELRKLLTPAWLTITSRGDCHREGFGSEQGTEQMWLARLQPGPQERISSR